jgi:FlaA1/EpsC-like NDP-sugar epimerase
LEQRWGYDYVLNLSALKHVRSEKDPFTMMRMIDVNIFNTEKTIRQSIEKGVRKYFCVSTDKAANPANMMGASKRIMEMFLMKYSEQITISTARFANVAFSDGSLLHGFNQRIQKRQPIVAPNDVKRYFVIPKESGELCLMSTIFGENRDIFFPKLSESLHLITFSDIAVRYLKHIGYEPNLCKSEEEARELAHTLPEKGEWPCLFTQSDTTGEKDFEEFFTENEVIDLDRFQNLGIVKNEAYTSSTILPISGVLPEVTFNIFSTVCSLSPGLIRSGLYPAKNSSLYLKPLTFSTTGMHSSSVTPG